MQPLATMIVFSLFFRRLGTENPQDVPYSLFVLSGLLCLIAALMVLFIGRSRVTALPEPMPAE